MMPIRSFIAIELPEDIKTSLRELQNKLKAGEQSAIKWVDTEGIHLTLKFLANITEDKVEGIIQAIKESVYGTTPFQIGVDGLGVFPSLRRVQVVWVGLNGDIDKIIQLQKNLDANLTPLGFIPESRKFTPHLTLARLREDASPAKRQELAQIIANTQFAITNIIKVEVISLMRSQLTRQGAIYSQIATIKLERTCQ